MAEKTATAVFPRRDVHGRVDSLSQFLAVVLGSTVLGAVILVAVDGLFALIGLGTFASASGWLACALPALLFFDDLRAWRAYRIRYLVGSVGLVVALGLGVVVAGLIRGVPSVVPGLIGSVVAAVGYTFIWFGGMRWLTGNREERGPQ
jgi:hypothetical protein